MTRIWGLSKPPHDRAPELRRWLGLSGSLRRLGRLATFHRREQLPGEQEHGVER
jgi:hypothetical protein